MLKLTQLKAGGADMQAFRAEIECCAVLIDRHEAQMEALRQRAQAGDRTCLRESNRMRTERRKALQRMRELYTIVSN